MLGIDPRQGRCQIIAQRQPIAGLVAFGIFLPRENALVRAVHIGEEFAKRLNRLHARAFQRVEPIAVINGGDLAEHLGPMGHLSPEIIAEPLWGLRLGTGGFLGLCHGKDPRCINWPRV